jgi:toxin-antitoxin system PIN domain toxin
LIYAHRQEFPHHRRARSILKELVEGPALWGLPIFVMVEFLRVVTHPRILEPPSDERTALSAINALLESTSVRVLSPGQRYWRVLAHTVLDGRVRGNLVYDAQIVSLCVEHGADTILSEDRDFRRFPQVSVRTLD